MWFALFPFVPVRRLYTVLRRAYDGGMSPGAQKLASRRALLAMVMLTLLALSVGGAWWLQHRAEGGIAGGKAVLDEIRRRGVAAFYGQDRSQQWMLGYESGPSPVGWRLQVLQTDGDTFVGRLRQEFPWERLNVQETWRLNADATAGDYESLVTRPNSPVGAQTAISLAGGKVTVQQLYPRFRGKAAAEAPVNYLPEGTIPAAVQVVAEQQARARFRLIYDQIDHTRGIQFRNVTLEYIGTDRTQEGQELRRVRESGDGGESVYELDPSGRIVAIHSKSTRWLAVDEDEVRAAFSGVPPIPEATEPAAEEEGGEF